MTMTYNGHSLKLYYEDFNYNIQPKNFKKTNISIIIYELFDYIESTENLYAKKIDGGFKYEGKISCGDFILIQNDDCSLKTLTFRNIDFSVSFT